MTSSHDIAKVPELKLDILINNAGMGVMAPMASVPMAKVRAIFDVNVFGMVELSQAVIPGMNYTAAGDVAATETADTLRDAVLPNQLDPMEIVMTLADLAEADETPMETILPEGVLESLQALREA